MYPAQNLEVKVSSAFDQTTTRAKQKHIEPRNEIGTEGQQRQQFGIGIHQVFLSGFDTRNVEDPRFIA